MEPHALEVDDDEGVVYAQVDELALAWPPRRAGRLAATVEELSTFSADVIPMHWLLDDLAAGRRREELEARIAASSAAFARALGYQLAVLDVRGDEARAYLAQLVARAPRALRAVLRETALETAAMRRAEAERIASVECASERRARRAKRSEDIEPERLDALVAEVVSGEGDARIEALAQLAARARPIAVELAEKVLLDDALLGGRARALLAAPTLAELHARIAEAGLTPSPRGHDLVSCLPEHADLVLLETSTDPVGHDHVLTRWAKLAPELGAWLFEEWGALHPDDDDAGDGRVHGVHRVRAFDGRRGVEVRLAASGSWLDVVGLVGFANTLLERGESATRFVIAEERAESAWVLAVPRVAVGRWRRVGLLGRSAVRVRSAT